MKIKEAQYRLRRLTSEDRKDLQRLGFESDEIGRLCITLMADFDGLYYKVIISEPVTGAILFILPCDEKGSIADKYGESYKNVRDIPRSVTNEILEWIGITF